MLDHADARDRVEGLVVELAVVLHADLDPVREASSATRCRASSACGCESVMPITLDPVALGRVDGEAAPAAAHVEHALALLQVELGADQLELRLLRLLERLGAAREDRTAVGHASPRNSAKNSLDTS